MRILAAALALFLLTSCGFEPVHAKRNGASGETVAGLEAIDIRVSSARVQQSNISTQQNTARMAQLLQAELEDQFNPDYIRAPKRYILNVSLTESIGSVFVNPDGTSSRNDVTLASNFSITTIDDPKVLRSGSMSRVSSYNVSERADYATYVAEQDARKRGIAELARAYKLRMTNAITQLKATR